MVATYAVSIQLVFYLVMTEYATQVKIWPAGDLQLSLGLILQGQ